MPSFADLVPGAEFHSFGAIGDCSLYGHRKDIVNAEIRTILEAV
jgi:hypothetical protein